MTKSSFAMTRIWICYFSGITSHCKNDSEIRYCAIGKCKKEIRWNGRIAGKISEEFNSIRNISIDINNSSSNNACDGESVSANLFKQRYFENTLGWDFDTVWMWDEQKNHPVLRQVGVQADTSGTTEEKKAVSAQTNTDDLLTQQIRANIWL